MVLPVRLCTSQHQICEPSRRAPGGAHRSGTGASRKQVRGSDVLRIDGGRLVRNPSDRHHNQHYRCPPACAYRAERVEGELGEEQVSFIDTCQLERDKLPEPGPPLTVGLDGGFVHARDETRRQAGSFEIIVEDGGAKCFAFVNRKT